MRRRKKKINCGCASALGNEGGVIYSEKMANDMNSVQDRTILRDMFGEGRGGDGNGDERRGNERDSARLISHRKEAAITRRVNTQPLRRHCRVTAPPLSTLLRRVVVTACG